MKLSNLRLLETQQTELSVTELIEVLPRDCAIALRLFKASKDRLYRGLGGTRANRKIITRADRKPKDSNAYSHELYNRLLSVFGGHSSWRSSSVFVTTNVNVAIEYGDPYVVIPIGDFEMLTSNVINDPYELLDVNNGGGRGLMKVVNRLKDPSIASTIESLILGSSIIEDIKRVHVAIADELKTNFIADYPAAAKYFDDTFIGVRFDKLLSTAAVRDKIISMVTSLCTLIAQGDGNRPRDYNACEILSTILIAEMDSNDTLLRKIFAPMKTDTSNKDAWESLCGEISVLYGHRGHTLIEPMEAFNGLVTSKAQVAELYEHILETVFQHAYQYYSSASQLTTMPKQRTSGAEIMVRCKEYYVVDLDTFSVVTRALKKSGIL